MRYFTLKQKFFLNILSLIVDHSTIYFNNAPVACANCWEHHKMYLDKKLNFLEYLKEKLFKSKVGYWSNLKLTKIEKLQYDAALEITDAI